jgi:hypothetical protein
MGIAEEAGVDLGREVSGTLVELYVGGVDRRGRGLEPKLRRRSRSCEKGLRVQPERVVLEGIDSGIGSVEGRRYGDRQKEGRRKSLKGRQRRRMRGKK